MSNFEGLYDIRDAKTSDHNFILATFLRGLYYGGFFFDEIPKDIFMQNYKRIAQNALVSPNVKIKIACLKEDPDVILGYSIVSSDDKAVVWIFVKTAWRQQGIGKSLLPKYPLFATHLTALGKTLLKDKLPGVVFNPFY